MATYLLDDFSLPAIARSGQTFTWQPRGGDGYLVSSGTRRCLATQRGRRLVVLSETGTELDEADRRGWEHYFALDRDYAGILGELDMPDDVVGSVRGIRVLAQDWWDAAVCFVISQNSTMARIQRTVDALMTASGGRVPRPAGLRDLLADEGLASGLGLGYRRPYLTALAERACGGWQPARVSDGTVTLEESMAELEESPGIGPKVASCVCLFGLGYEEAVPRDTWIRRAEREHGIRWHPRYGGIQQQYVFAWMRKRR